MHDATLIEVGSPAPHFRLSVSNDREIGLADYVGKTNVVLFFVRAYT